MLCSTPAVHRVAASRFQHRQTATASENIEGETDFHKYLQCTRNISSNISAPIWFYYTGQVAGDQIILQFRNATRARAWLAAQII